MLIEDLLVKYNIKTAPSTLKPNFIHVPVTRIPVTEEGARIFNELYNATLAADLNQIIRTESNGISFAHGNLRLPAYDVIEHQTEKGKFSGVEITLLLKGMCRIQFSNRPDNVMPGNVAFKEFCKICKRFGVDIKDYAVDPAEGKAIKEEITPPKIMLRDRSLRHLTLTNVHHMDYHSSYATGLINTHPEFAPAIQYMYNHRHVMMYGREDWYKGVLNCSIGYMQSKYSHYAYTALARDAINDNNNRIDMMAQRLRDADRVIISYNTDGIWYAGEIYHDADEGKGLGTWQNDHINCTFRAKSDGAYEYIENGKYTPVVRGRTRYDTIKDRSEWQWGDIFREDCRSIAYEFSEEEGIEYVEINR